MKKITAILTSLFLSFIATSSFAAVTFGDVVTSNGKDYVGKIVAVNYVVEPTGQAIRIVTKADDKLNENDMARGGVVEFSDKDLPMGVALAANIGKNVAVSFDIHSNVRFVTIITNEYWNGSK